MTLQMVHPETQLFRVFQMEHRSSGVLQHDLSQNKRTCMVKPGRLDFRACVVE
jgi:hypothetical protein